MPRALAIVCNDPQLLPLAYETLALQDEMPSGGFHD